MEELGDYALALLLRLVVAPLRRERVLTLHAVRLHQLADLVLLHQGPATQQRLGYTRTDRFSYRATSQAGPSESPA